MGIETPSSAMMRVNRVPTRKEEKSASFEVPRRPFSYEWRAVFRPRGFICPVLFYHYYFHIPAQYSREVKCLKRGQ
jgi:hypothetical protein